MKKAVVAVAKVLQSSDAMFKQDTIEITRDCDALLIPSGVKISIQKGTLVMITQALGNAYTVYVNGNLARVAGKDGDVSGAKSFDGVSDYYFL